jgi:Flp pilus assembly protein TadD
VYLNEGNNKAAMGEYQTILKKTPNDPMALNNLAWLYQQANDSRAIETARYAYKINPQSPQVADTLGWILVAHGEGKEALTLLEKATAMSPDSAEIRYHYGVALAQTGDKAKAKQVLKELLNSGKEFGDSKQAQKLLDNL